MACTRASFAFTFMYLVTRSSKSHTKYINTPCGVEDRRLKMPCLLSRSRQYDLPKRRYISAEIPEFVTEKLKIQKRVFVVSLILSRITDFLSRRG